MDQTIILVDDRDKFKGYTTWREGHYGRGKRHRGFVVLLFDEAGNVYLQKRKHRVFDGLWDLTAISHPYHLGGEGNRSIKSNKGIKGRDESLEEAALRSLKNEMGIARLAEDGESRRGKVELTDIGAFVYFAKDGEWCENEYCHVLVGKFDGRFKPNKKFVYEAKKMPFGEFVGEVNKSQERFTPWAVKSIKSIKGNENSRFWTSENDEQGEFAADLEKFRKEFEKYAKGYFAQRAKLTKKYPKLIQTFYGELEEFGKGGKLLRPYLLWIGYRLSQSQRGRGKENLKNVLPVCMAVELVHSFLLIHDDIIDRADLRREKLTVHKKFERLNGVHYGTSMGILAGDLALVEAIELFREGTEGLRDKGHKVYKGSRDDLAQEMLLDIIRDTIYGEALDVEYSYSKANIDQIWQVIDLKTAKYSFVGPLTLGFMLGQLQTKAQRNSKFKVQSAKLEEYGMLVGRAYQLKDDLLAVFGDEKVIGKSGLSDMREGKHTVLLYKALEMSGQTQRQFISRYWGNEKANAKDLEQMKNIFEKSGAFSWCQKRLEKLAADAKTNAKQITKETKLQEILVQLADFAAMRDN